MGLLDSFGRVGETVMGARFRAGGCLAVGLVFLGCSSGASDAPLPGDDVPPVVDNTGDAGGTVNPHGHDAGRPSGGNTDAGSQPPPSMGDDAGTVPPGDDAGTVPPGDDAGTVPPPPPVDGGSGSPGGPCVATVPRGSEDTDALCSNGIDDDCNGYIDCNDFRCSRNRMVTVCMGGGTHDAGTPPPPPVDAGTPPTDGGTPPPPTDGGTPGSIGPTGGTVDLMRFGVFGDVRPAAQNSTSHYPTAVFTSVLHGIQAAGAQFIVSTGDYMFATTAANVDAQVSMFRGVEAGYPGHIFHGLGNHECNGASTSNCPNGNETANMMSFRTQLAPGYAAPYYDFVIHTRLGDAHFIMTAPNAWSSAEQSWLNTALAQPARYTIVTAHEPPGRREAPGTPLIEAAIAAHPGAVALRLYGHTHEYRHVATNGVINGNAGAPLASTSGSYGFAIVEQRADGNLVFTAYDVGSPPMVADTFVVTPSGAATH